MKMQSCPIYHWGALIKICPMRGAAASTNGLQLIAVDSSALLAYTSFPDYPPMFPLPRLTYLGAAVRPPLHEGT